MTTTTKLVGAPIAIDHLPTKTKHETSTYRFQITFDCGTYNDILVFEFPTESDKNFSAMMWQQFIEKAKDLASE
jgi:hypothetical protein